MAHLFRRHAVARVRNLRIWKTEVWQRLETVLPAQWELVESFDPRGKGSDREGPS